MQSDRGRSTRARDPFPSAPNAASPTRRRHRFDSCTVRPMDSSPSGKAPDFPSDTSRLAHSGSEVFFTARLARTPPPSSTTDDPVTLRAHRNKPYTLASGFDSRRGHSTPSSSNGKTPDSESEHSWLVHSGAEQFFFARPSRHCARQFDFLRVHRVSPTRTEPRFDSGSWRTPASSSGKTPDS